MRTIRSTGSVFVAAPAVEGEESLPKAQLEALQGVADQARVIARLCRSNEELTSHDLERLRHATERLDRAKAMAFIGETASISGKHLMALWSIADGAVTMRQQLMRALEARTHVEEEDWIDRAGRTIAGMRSWFDVLSTS